MENEVPKVSVIFDLFESIDKRLEELVKKLKPITKNLPSSENVIKEPSTELASRLYTIEDKIRTLLGNIEL